MQKTPLVVLGRSLGTHWGWDEAGRDAILVYNFEPSFARLGQYSIDEVRPCDTLLIDYHNGILSGADGLGNTLFKLDLVYVCSIIARLEPVAP